MTEVSPRSRSRRATGKVRPADARRHHLAMVLQRLFDDGPRSRADLARETGLTRVTVSDLVSELVDDGILTDLGTRPGTHQGKPATLVGLSDRSPVAIALDLSGDSTVQGAVVDLHGAVLAKATAPVATGQQAVDTVLALVQRLREDTGRRVVGVGIGTPGVVDQRGIVLHAPNLGWTDLDLAERVRTATGLPTYVGNDADLATTAESAYGAGDSAGLLVVTVSHGVGGGVLLDGRVLSGPLLSSGEIGHVVVDPDGAPCACGNRGCLETVLSVPALRRQSDDAARARTGAQLGSVLTPIVATLGIADVVIYGPTELLEGPLLDAARRTLAHQTLPFVAQRVHLRMEPSDAELVLKGAAAHVRYREMGVV